MQQLLAEGLLLGVGGGLAGFLAAYYGVDVLLAAFGQGLPRANEVKVDGQVLAFTAAIAMATGALAAFAPAWQLTGRDANDVLKTGSEPRQLIERTAGYATCSSFLKWRSR